MTLTPHLWRALGRGIALAISVAVAASVAPIASAQILRQQEQTPPQTQTQPQPEAVDKNELFRQQVAKPLEAADELIKAEKYAEAMVKIREAEQIADRTPLEAYLIDRMRGITAAGLGDKKTAISSFEAVLASGRSPQAEQLKLTEAIAAMYFKAEDYRNATSWAQRYFKAGGTNPEMRMQLVRSLYLSEQHAAAATELRAMVDADEKAGVKAALDRLQLLASSYVKMNNGAGYAYALEKLLTYYPKKEYWTDAIGRVQRKQGFPEHLQLDVLRLQEATGTLADAAQYTAMAQLALKIGQPGEAKRVIDQGFAAGVLGTGPDADQQRKLRDTAAKLVADDEKVLAQNAKDAAAAKDGNALINVGYAMVSAGQFEKGIAQMEQGMQKGGLRQPDEARLHLAIAYLGAGQKAKAVAAFKQVQSDAAADLARLWLIHAQRSSG